MTRGDGLLYGPKGFFGYAIALKTWMKVAHVEVYAGDGMSWASRDGQGVGLYPVREDRLIQVLRPVRELDIAGMREWFLTVDGQGYDWFGLARFLAWGRIGTGDNGKMFCSEFATRLYRAGGLDPFNGCDADAIAPATFLLSNGFTKVVSDAPSQKDEAA